MCETGQARTEQEGMDCAGQEGLNSVLDSRRTVCATGGEDQGREGGQGLCVWGGVFIDA